MEFEDDFESQFADELDALNDIESVSRSKTSTQVRKSLSFSTTPPKVVSTADDARSPELQLLSNSILEQPSPACFSRKRSRTEDEKHLDKENISVSGLKISKRIPHGHFISVTNSNGQRAYLPIEEKKTSNFTDASLNLKQGQLLGKPVTEMMLEVDKMRMKHVMEDDIDVNHAVTDQNDAEALWVNRYCPDRYTELLSDETTNRTLLTWLKLWDRVVFGKESVSAKALADKKKKRKSDTFQGNEKKFKDSKTIASETLEELDEFDRPLKKVALLAGPPGLGKTTLAHVVARHAGYRPIEMNASDDRSAEIFKQRIASATQMRALNNSDPRPNCLIIDEIDGAPQAAINVLLGVLKRTGAKVKRRVEGELLRRPIICICNDVYAPALRLLRQQAMVINFPKIISGKLASRLKEILREENMRADVAALLSLCERSENDIRSCLNTLQFIRGKYGELTSRSIAATTVGEKDVQRGLYAVWSSIFTLPKVTRQQYVNPHDRDKLTQQQQISMHLQQDKTSRAARFTNILQLSQSCGEQDKMTQGLFENYLEAKVKQQDSMDRLIAASDWLCFVDQLQRQIMRSQTWTLARYRHFLNVAFHLLLASNRPGKLAYPTSQSEAHMKRTHTEQLIGSLTSDLRPTSRLPQLTMVLQLLPALVEIISPPLRPVNTQLYSAEERRTLQSLIEVMLTFNLSYIQEKGADDQFAFNMDPNLDEIVRFTEIKPQTRQLTYAAKQFIAHEIELERMRRGDSGSSAKDDESFKPKLKTVVANKKQAEKSENMAAKKDIKPEKDAEKVTLDFFGRRITKVPTSSGTDNKKEAVQFGEIWFQFKEGFTNAVRKPLKIKQLL